MIESDADLIRVVAEINERLQSVHDYLGDQNHDAARIRFPRGYLRTCAHHRNKYSFLNDKVLQATLRMRK